MFTSSTALNLNLNIHIYMNISISIALSNSYPRLIKLILIILLQNLFFKDAVETRPAPDRRLHYRLICRRFSQLNAETVAYRCTRAYRMLK